ncbi:DUF4013 domain-containing protein [Natronosalvus caseinilyticus]|uniref:DUF4013 domain-containing protein n=1 Tax=Natronosalvus caseinilyticus TaxID=2953747 RepID=UPI0028AE0637|nr:DUF4013 domain-containing protein [Natronosalvus caseinilyticus]
MDDALAYPLRGDHAETSLIAAWLCVLVHVLVVPVLPLVALLGYVVSVLVLGSERDPPPFLERTVLRQALGAAGIAIAYGTVPLVIALSTVRLLTESGEVPSGGGTFAVLVGSTTVLLVLGIAAYLLPIALANYGRAGSIRAGFADIVSVAGHGAYFVGWASGITLLLVGLALSSALVSRGGVALVAGTLIGAYAVLVSSRRIGRGYAAGRR